MRHDILNRLLHQRNYLQPGWKSVSVIVLEGMLLSLSGLTFLSTLTES